MGAQIIDGKAIADGLRETVRARVEERVHRRQPRPGLAVVLIGDAPASLVYVRNKKLACEWVGMNSFEFSRPAVTSEAKLLDLIGQLNADERVNGILIQLPLPGHIDTNKVIEAISPDKDVDGFHPYNIGRLNIGRPVYRPCTPQGIMSLLEFTGIKLAGMDAVIVGRSNIVGRPLIAELLDKDCTPTICHSYTRDIGDQVRGADIVIAAVGRPGFIQGTWIKPGAIVIDVGINHLPNGRLSGDVDFESARQVAGYITPVPGGVGPMTIACLLQNTLIAAESR